MNSRLVVWSAVIAMFFTFSPAVEAEEDAIIVAVFLMESQGSGLKADEVVNLTDYMATMLGQGGQLQIIPRDEIRKRLVQSKSESHKECYDTSCQIELGRELAAQYSISSKIGRVGRQCLITAQVFDLKTSTMIKAVPGRGPCDPDSLINSVTALAEELKVEMLSRPAPREPVVEPEPVVDPEPVVTAPPPQETPPPAETAGPRLPRFFLSAGLGVTNVSWLDLDADDSTFVGFASSIDWRIGKGFMLGFMLDFELTDNDYVGEIGYFDLMMRLGYLIPLIDGRILLHPYGAFGFGSQVYMDYDEADAPVAIILGAGFGVRWMFLSWLGLSADLGLEYATWFPTGEEDWDAEASFDVKFNLGLTLGF